MSSSPNGTDGNCTASGVGTTNNQQFDVPLGNSGLTHLEVGKSYTVNASSTNVAGATLNVGVPAGYEVVINGVRRRSLALTYGAAVICILPRGDGPPGAAGFASSVSASSVDWRVSLGGLRNGSEAGSLRLVDSGVMTDDWATLATPAALNYEAVSDEVFVYREDNIIKQIIANQVALDVVALNGTSYEIKCYNPAQGTGTAPTTFGGEPFAVYRVTLGSTATSLNFTKETREITSLTATGVAIARTEVMSLKREGAWPHFQWTKDDWTLSGQNALSRVVVKGELKPVILAQPTGKAVVTGSTATFTVVASGVPSPSYQWKKNGNAITGNTTATLATLQIPNAQAADAAAYTVTLSNALDTVTSMAANLAVYTAPSGNYLPIITQQPVSQSAFAGSSLVLSVGFVANPVPTFQWLKGGTAIAGATNSSFALAPLATTDAANYTVTLTNSAGAVTSVAANLIVTAARSETVTVGAAVGGATSLALTRNYTNGTAGEVLSSQDLGSTNPASISFAYYGDSAQSGSWGFTRSVTLPGGGWEAYDYYDNPTSSAPRIGQVSRRYRPFGAAPATATQTATQGEVTYFEYGADTFGYLTRPTLVRTTVNDTVVSQSTTTYSTATGPYSSVAMTVATQADLAAGTTVLTTVRTTYAENAGDAFIRGQPYSIKGPDGTTTTWSYERGTWNGTTFTPASATANGPGTGTASRIIVTANQNTSLVDGKSTREASIRDERALVVRTESSVWKNGAWQLVGWTNTTYNLAGLPTARASSNGATYSATYSGLQKVSETDETGATTTYTYDVAGRVSVSTRSGVGAIASVATRFTYDAVGHVLSQEEGWGGSELLVSTKSFDTAGRVTAETTPGISATTHTYNVAARTHTTTRPDGATTIETAGLDGRPVSVTGTAVVAEHRTYGVDTSTGQRWEQTNLGSAGSPRWSKVFRDRLGRVVLTQRSVFPGQSAYEDQNFYDDVANRSSTGHLIKNKKTDTAATFYVYDTLGRVNRSGIDVNGSGALESLSQDRITETDTFLESFGGAWWWRTESRGYAQVSSATPIITSITRKRLTGFAGNRQAETQTTDILGNVTTQTTDVVRSTATVTSTSTQTGVANAEVVVAVLGLTTSSTGRDALTTTFGYDALRRRTTVTVPRNSNTTTTAYKSGTGLPQTVTVNGVTPVAPVTTYFYDTSGRQTSVVDPDNKTSYQSYTARGQMHRQWGSAAVPVEYGYDTTYGERTTMRTYRNPALDFSQATWPTTGPTDADTTTWTYDPASGLLASKTDAANKTVAYLYSSSGQLTRRTWARAVTTDYLYDPNTGEQRDILYSDSTPTLHYTYDRMGMVSTIEDATGVRTQAHCLCGKLASEQLDTSFYGGRLLAYQLEETSGGVLGRTLGYTLSAGATVEQSTVYAYDSATRFSTLTTQSTAAAARTFRYGYLANSDLLSGLTIDGNSSFAVSRVFDPKRDLLTSIDTAWGSSVAHYDYTYNVLSQRSSVTQSGSAFADYGAITFQSFGYNPRGELTSARAYLGTAVDENQTLQGRQYAYEFDHIGNRVSDNRTGNINSPLKNTYTANALNQYTDKTNKSLAVSGTKAEYATSVAVRAGSQNVLAERRGRYWNAEIENLNTSVPWRNLLSIYTGKAGSPAQVQTSVRLAQIAPRTQTFTYDLDGNLLTDGVWTYLWDAENRLVRMTAMTEAVNAGYPNQVIEFRYDYLGRRVQKLVIDAAANRLISGRRFLYDGWNLIAEYSITAPLSAPNLVRTYTWGLDIARSLADAGGVGALLQITDHGTGRSFLPAYDGNGNIAALLNATSGELAAAYEYSPFGEQIRAQSIDSAAVDQPFRFSTKYTDSETGLVYYGRRYYDPKTGRFPSRDPIDEKGGWNLYAIVWNNPINKWDYLGMCGGPGQAPCQMAPFVVNGGGFSFSSGPTYYGGGNWDTGFDFGGWNTTIDIPVPDLPPLDLKRQRTAKCSELFTLQGQAKLMDDSYRPSASGKIDGTDYERLTNDQLTQLGWNLNAAALTNTAGFSASVYRDTQTGQIAVAYRGSEMTVSDWVTNLITQPAGISSQYSQAAIVGQQAAAVFGPNVLQLGHSLGGGLAATAALTTGTQAVTMNPAGISWLTASNLNLDLSNAPNLVTAWTHQGEILSGILNPLPLVPDTNGMPHGLPAADGSGSPVARHGMASVLGSISDQMTKNGCVF